MLAIFVKWLWTGKIGPLTIANGDVIILRETMPAMRRTVMREFIDMLHLQNIIQFIDWRKSTHEFFYKGRRIAFMPADQESKILGMQTVMFWMNEPNNVEFNIFMQLLMRCENMAFLDYNPFDSMGWINQELELKRMINKPEEVNLTISTYKDNPHLHEGIIKEIEGLAEVDEALFEVYNSGAWATLTGLVYKNYTIELPPPKFFENSAAVLGLDFGFSHPAAIVLVLMFGKDIFLQELFFAREALTSDLIDFLYSRNLHTMVIIADNARPEAIKEMKKNGLKVKPARKGRDSVKQGINNVKLYNIFVSPESTNLINEFRRYRWHEKQEEQTEEPVKLYDDCLDAARYGVNYLHRGSSRIKIL